MILGIYDSDGNLLWQGDHDSPEAVAVLNEHKGETVYFAYLTPAPNRPSVPLAERTAS